MNSPGTIRSRVTITWRPALDDVCDIDVLAGQVDGLDDSRQKLSRPADERQSLTILLRAWCLADKHQIGIGIPAAEDHRATSLVESTSGAPAGL